MSLVRFSAAFLPYAGLGRMKRLILETVLISIILLIAPHALAAKPFPARVVGVVDGDTLRVSRKEGGTVKVRLYGIDCPERNQEHGKEARRLTVKLAYGRVVFVEKRGKYPYGGIIGRMSLPSGKFLSRALVRDGACWWYKRYAPKDETLKKLEARANKCGLWANQKPVPPWRRRDR